MILKRTLLGLLAAIWLALPLQASEIALEDLEVFFEMVAVGPLTAVNAALAESPALATASDPDGFAPIHMLDYTDFGAKLGLLLSNGADINTVNDEGIGLVHILIDAGFLPVILAAGANPNLQDTMGRTPLMLFAQEPDSQEMIRGLIAAGVDATLLDKDGHSAWWYARMGGQDSDVLQMLGAAGAPRK